MLRGATRSGRCDRQGQCPQYGIFTEAALCGWLCACGYHLLRGAWGLHSLAQPLTSEPGQPEGAVQGREHLSRAGVGIPVPRAALRPRGAAPRRAARGPGGSGSRARPAPGARWAGPAAGPRRGRHLTAGRGGRAGRLRSAPKFPRLVQRERQVPPRRGVGEASRRRRSGSARAWKRGGQGAMTFARSRRGSGSEAERAAARGDACWDPEQSRPVMSPCKSLLRALGRGLRLPPGALGERGSPRGLHRPRGIEVPGGSAGLPTTHGRWWVMSGLSPSVGR